MCACVCVCVCGCVGVGVSMHVLVYRHACVILCKHSIGVRVHEGQCVGGCMLGSVWGVHVGLCGGELYVSVFVYVIATYVHCNIFY